MMTKAFRLRWKPWRAGRCRVVIAALMLWGAIASPSCGDEPASDSRINEAFEITTNAALLYEFQLAGDANEPLDFSPRSVLRWSNPEAGEIYGNVFLWTRNGRPEVVGSFLQWYSPFTHGSHEFQSLSTKPLTGQRNGKKVWMTDHPGITLTPIPDAPNVAETSAVRLRQARALARGFQIRKTDREDQSRELRLLAQPLARYGDEESAIMDGALFAFVQGTDPETFLVLEVRQDNDRWQWHYALAPMNSVRFVATYLNQTVWQTEILPWASVKSGRLTYTSFGPFEAGQPNP